MREDIKDIFSKAYDNFIMRDLNYVFSGGLIYACIYYTFGNSFECGIRYITNNFFIFIIFLIASYFSGIIVHEVVLSAPYLFKTEAKIPESYRNDYVLFMAGVMKEYGSATVRRLERTTYLMLMGSSIGSALLINFFIISYRFTEKGKIHDIAISAIFLLLTVGCVIINRKKYKELNRNIEILASEIKSSNNLSSF